MRRKCYRKWRCDIWTWTERTGPRAEPSPAPRPFPAHNGAGDWQREICPLIVPSSEERLPRTKISIGGSLAHGVLAIRPTLSLAISGMEATAKAIAKFEVRIVTSVPLR